MTDRTQCERCKGTGWVPVWETPDITTQVMNEKGEWETRVFAPGPLRVCTKCEGSGWIG